MDNQQLAYDLDRDVRVLSAMASSLTPYLYENEMYGYLPGDLPRLTLGGLLMRLYRLSRLEDLLTTGQKSAVQTAKETFEAERSQWAAHYDAKLQHELKSRLSALDQFLYDCGEDLQGCVFSYPVQAEKRVMIEHLHDEAQARGVMTDELDTRLKQVDQKLRRVLADGGFIFDPRLQDAYPRTQYWWLYGSVTPK